MHNPPEMRAASAFGVNASKVHLIMFAPKAVAQARQHHL